MADNLRRTMIRAAAKKGIYDIREDPERGIRNLVDLGDMFAMGRFQKDFFQVAQVELANPNSVYYQLVNRVVQDTDPDLLLQFGMNLGYQCWTSGATIIRDMETAGHFNIPWTLVFDLSGPHSPDTREISRLVTEGKALGVYCYQFFLGGAYGQVFDLYSFMASQPDCVFGLYVAPDQVDEKMAAQATTSKNLFVGVKLDGSEQLQAALDLLAAQRCLYGCYTGYDSLETAARQSGILGGSAPPCPFLFLIDKTPLTPESGMTIADIRGNLQTPVFPIDFYRDIAHIDRNISSEACIAQVAGDGSVELIHLDQLRVSSGFSIYEQGLEDIFRLALPKNH